MALTQHLLRRRGPEWHTGLESEPGPTVKELLTELYVRVGATRQWALIRYISGILKKKVEALDEVRAPLESSGGAEGIGGEAAGRARELWLHLPGAEAPRAGGDAWGDLAVPRPARTCCLTRST